MKHADEAIYQAKALGRKRCCVSQCRQNRQGVELDQSWLSKDTRTQVRVSITNESLAHQQRALAAHALRAIYARTARH